MPGVGERRVKGTVGLLRTDAGACDGAGADQGLLGGALAVFVAVLVEGGLNVLHVAAADGGEVVGGVLLADDAEEACGWVGEDAQGEGEDWEEDGGAHLRGIAGL